MNSLLILLASVVATFAWPSEEWNFPNPTQYGAPWDINENIDTNINTEATEQARRPRQEVFQPGHIYLMLGNNNLFLSTTFFVGGGVYTQSIKSQQDEFCRYAVSVLDNGKVAFRDLAGEGLYLQLNTGGIVINSITPTSKVIDDSAQFEVEVSGPGPWKGAHYVHLKAQNGNYCGLIDAIVKDNLVAQYEDAERGTRLIVLEAL